jgi:dihydroxyacetone kinase-like protein
MADYLEAHDLKRIFGKISKIIKDDKEMLSNLDAKLGDGDLGIAMAKGFAAVSESLENSGEKDIGRLLVNAGMTMAKTAPSTLGTLLAMGFMQGGKSVSGEVMTTEGFIRFLKGFTEEIMNRGKSAPGEKTIVDSLYPALQAAIQAYAMGSHMNSVLRDACKAAQKGAEDTKNMVSKHGRGAYYQEKSLGLQDGGAAVGAILLRAFSERNEPDEE